MKYNFKLLISIVVISCVALSCSSSFESKLKDLEKIEQEIAENNENGSNAISRGDEDAISDAIIVRESLLKEKEKIINDLISMEPNLNNEQKSILIERGILKDNSEVDEKRFKNETSNRTKNNDTNINQNQLYLAGQTVKANIKKVYFYSQPDNNSKTESYFVNGQEAFITEGSQGDFIKVSFEYNNVITEGYILKSEVVLKTEMGN